jgi:hypothetical protein
VNIDPLVALAIKFVIAGSREVRHGVGQLSEVEVWASRPKPRGQFGFEPDNKRVGDIRRLEAFRINVQI